MVRNLDLRDRLGRGAAAGGALEAVGAEAAQGGTSPVGGRNLHGSAEDSIGREAVVLLSGAGHARYHRPVSTESHAPMTIRLALAAALALAAGSAGARWSVVTGTHEDAAAGTGVARVENASGHSFRIYRDGDGMVRAILMIDGRRLEAFDPERCPTLQVDGGVPVVPPTGGTSCLLDATRARFSLGRIEDGRIVVSDVLLELMNGSRLIFRYRTRVGDYRETEFTLLGSMHAVGNSLGAGVRVFGTAR